MQNLVRIVEVGPRDGLQNEPGVISARVKADLVGRLADAGIRHIEAGSFVSAKWVPQMASSDEVFALIDRQPGVRYSALTPNLKGFEAATASNVSEIAVFTAASESFCRKNTNCSIEESLERFRPVLEAAHAAKLPVRGYISCVLGCPYEGEISVPSVVELANKLIELGCYEVSLGDTIGTGTPKKAAELARAVASSVPAKQVAVHFHDTYGQALANIYACLDEGIRTVDSSVAGLGGCPYAPGASGNVATEDVVYMLHGCGMETGVNLEQLIEVGNWISQQLGRSNKSKVASALSRAGTT